MHFAAANWIKPCFAVDSRRSATLLVLALPLLFHLGFSLWLAFTTPFPSPIDELQHISFVQTMASEPKLFPDHSGLVVEPLTEGEARKPNYLNHPSPYYLALGLAWDAGASVESQVLKLRLINVALAALAMAIMLLAGASALPDIPSRAVFSAALVLFPKTAAAAGLVNNDALVLLATAIVFAGLVRLLRSPHTGAAALLGTGLALAGWTKLTALIMLGTAASLALLVLVWSRPSVGWRPAFVAAAVAALGAIPTAINLLVTGRIIWTSPTHNAVPLEARPDFSFVQFLLHFFDKLALKWPALEPAAPIQLASLAAVLFACLVLCRRFLLPVLHKERMEPLVLVALAFVLALPFSVGVHVIYGWTAFLAIGDLTSAQMRYYGPLWPGIALAMTLLHREILSPRLRLASSLAMGELLLISSPAVALFLP